MEFKGMEIITDDYGNYYIILGVHNTDVNGVVRYTVVNLYQKVLHELKSDYEATKLHITDIDSYVNKRVNYYVDLHLSENGSILNIKDINTEISKLTFVSGVNHLENYNYYVK